MNNISTTSQIVRRAAEVFQSQMRFRARFMDDLNHEGYGDSEEDALRDLGNFSGVIVERWERGLAVPGHVQFIAHVRVAESQPVAGLCPDCRGTGEYRGLIVVEPCRTCDVAGSPEGRPRHLSRNVGVE